MNNNRVSMTVFGASFAGVEEAEAPGGRSLVKRLPEVRGRRHVPRIAQFLIDSIWGQAGAATPRTGSPAMSFNESLSTIARSRSGKGVMVLLSDCLVGPEEGGYEGGLRALAAAGGRGFDTWCIQILSPAELEPEREVQQGVAGDLRLTDAETGRAAEVTMTAGLIKQYKQRLKRYCAELHSFAAAREMTHVIARSDSPLDVLILETLRRQGMLG